jgi:hypothetical protein
VAMRFLLVNSQEAGALRFTRRSDSSLRSE